MRSACFLENVAHVLKINLESKACGQQRHLKNVRNLVSVDKDIDIATVKTLGVVFISILRFLENFTSTM